MSKKNPRDYSAIDEITDREAFLESVREGFKDIRDPRVEDNQRYRFVDLLVIMVCAVLAGANTITDIHDYAKQKIGMFRQFLQIDRAPGYGVFWWLLARIDPKQLESSFVRWINSVPDDDKIRLIAIDGKHLRGVARSKQIHLVSAWDSNRSLLLGQVKADEKSNEITAIPELLDNLDLTNAIVTIDAAGCQTNIIEKIVERGGNYVIALKGNQGTLHAEAKNFFSQARAVGHKEADCKVSTSCEKGHGRIEEREIVITSRLDWLNCKAGWKDLKSLIEVTASRCIKGKTTVERRFYISNLELTPERAGEVIRSHWTIENRLHWNMDVNFCEDAGLAAVGHIPENLAMLRRLTSTMIRIDLGGVLGTAQRRRQATWNDSWALRLLSRLFEVPA
jgi:predicted transposase YbfD/YdcC